MTPRRPDELWLLLRAAVDPSSLRWLEEAIERVRQEPAALAPVFPAVGRRVGRHPLRPAEPASRPTNGSKVAGTGGGDQRPPDQGGSEPQTVEDVGSRDQPASNQGGDQPGAAGDVGSGGSGRSGPGAGGSGPGAVGGDLHGWTVDDAGRALLLLAAGVAVWGELDDLYRYGDAAERRGVLRALHLLPGPAGDAGSRPDIDEAVSDVGLRLVDDAVRTNDPRLLAAALGPYAVGRLSDDVLDQAILKCVFVGVPLAGIEGLAERATPSLARMLAAYVRERVAAGRDVPADVWPLIESHPPHDELAALEAELEHPVEGRRRAAAAALAQRSAHLTRAP